MYDDLLPGERVRLHAQYVAALQSGAARGTAAELARHARLAMDLDTALSASIQAGDEAWPSAARTRRRTTTSRRSSCSPTRAAATDADLDLSKLVVERRRRAERPAATRSAADALVQEQLDRLPADAPPEPGARGCSPPGPAS